MPRKAQIFEAAVANCIPAVRLMRNGVYSGAAFDADEAATRRAIQAGFTSEEVQAEAERRIDGR